MTKFLKDLVEMLAVSAYSEAGDRAFDMQEYDEISAPAHRPCSVPVSA